MSQTQPLFMDTQESVNLLAPDKVSEHATSSGVSQLSYANPRKDLTFVIKRANTQNIDDIVESQNISLSAKKCCTDNKEEDLMDDEEMPEDIVKFQEQNKKLRAVIAELKIVDEHLCDILKSSNRRFYP